MGVFPIARRSFETGHYTQKPTEYREAFVAAFRAATGQKSTYYAFDVTINSRTDVEFIAYDMRDNMIGGIGKEIWRGKATVPAALTSSDVERAVLREAIIRREVELDAAEQAIIDGYVGEILATLDGTP